MENTVNIGIVWKKCNKSKKYPKNRLTIILRVAIMSNVISCNKFVTIKKCYVK